MMVVAKKKEAAPAVRRPRAHRCRLGSAARSFLVTVAQMS